MINEHLPAAILIAGFILCVVLFTGDPDLSDAIIHALTDGKLTAK